MAKVLRKNGAIAVTFTNDVRTPALEPGFDGTVSQLSWDNAFLMPGLRAMFGCQPDERIVAIEVDNHGIKAKFERS